MNFFMFLAVIFISLIIYCYIAYPVALWFSANIFGNSKSEASPKNRLMPEVTLLIPGHNIRHLINRKIKNIMNLQYEGNLTFLFVLDGCNDGSKELLESYHDKETPYPIKIYASSIRVGKEAAIANALKNVCSEVLVFSDADAILDLNCVDALVETLMKHGIGAVSGREIHQKISNNGAGEGQGLFYKYEEFIKTHLTKIGSLPYVQGGNFAMLRKLYPEKIPTGCTQDGIIAFDVVLKGYRVAYEPNAVSREEYSLSSKEDFLRRVRTVNRALYSILCRPKIFNPIKTGWYFIHVFSGRVLRWFTLFFGFFAVISLLASGSPVAVLLTMTGAAIWIIFLLLGLFAEEKGIRIKLPYFVFYFTYIHVAAAIAVLKVMLGIKTTTWKPSR
ncbi:glycosyltransferase [uncultured Microbulbifer sp.]|uniref:glycosyltransferase n=1 Tax=uncultured Microbulbifer sp. TaxID=348147 RepID=UPI00261C1FB4|nr:glycosyltransferase [uncultured Microbulbifer sp.]